MVTRTNGAGSDGHMSTAEANTYYYHSDHLGSAQLITDNEGKEYERIEYTPYGEYWIEKRAPENKTLPFKFTGKERDEETGLYYYGARYLDPRTSRWLSTDPALGEYMAGSKAGAGGIYNQVNFNLYHYAGNNPVKYTDPDGKSERDYRVVECVMTMQGIAQGISIGGLPGGIVGALMGYAAAKDLQNYNGPLRDMENEKALKEAFGDEGVRNPADLKTFKIDEADDFHQVEGISITKYKTIKDGKETGGEIIWDNTNNKPVTDPKARGTFNRGRNNNPITHGEDVLLWGLLGTGEDDPSNMEDRAGQLIDSGIKRVGAFFNGLFKKKTNTED